MRKRRHFTAENKDAICQLYRHGVFTKTEIVKRYDLTYQMLSDWLKIDWLDESKPVEVKPAEVKAEVKPDQLQDLETRVERLEKLIEMTAVLVTNTHSRSQVNY